MNYRIENKKINLDRMVPTSTFKDGNIYSYSKLTKPSVLKIYNKNFEEMPEEDQIRYLSRIKSVHILMPNKLLYGNGKFVGYSLRSINRTGKFTKLVTTPIDMVYNNLRVIEEEISYLSSKNVVLRGMNYLDTIFNGEFFITNPDRYVTINNANIDSFTKIEDLNTYLFNNLLQEVFSHELNGEKINRSNITKFIDMLSDKDVYIKNSDFIDDNISEDNIREFVKKL